MKKIYYSIVIIMLFISGVYSAECEDGAVIWEVVFSIDDPTFSQEYDGTSGIIEIISRNDTTNQYSLWQTSQLNSINTYPWGGESQNYGVYAGNIADFTTDSEFESKKNNLLILNSDLTEFDFYYKISLKNTGTCHYTNNAWIVGYDDKTLRSYGMNDWNSYLENPITPSGIWEFRDTPQSGIKSKTFKVSYSDIVNFGRVMIRIGPEDIYSNPEFQKVNAYFWMNGTAGYCGDNILHSNEECDDGNNNDGDLCSATCEIELCEDNIQVENVIFSLDDPFFSQEYDGTSGIIQRVMYNKSTNNFSLWQTTQLDSINSYPWGSTSKIISYNNGDIKNNIYLDSNFNVNKNNVLVINEDGSNNFNMYYKVTLRNTGTCNYNDDSIVDRRYGNRILNYGSSTWNYFFSKVNSPAPSTWYPSNINANMTTSRVFQVKNNDLINYGRLELRVGPHDRYRKSGEKHYQYFNANFFIDLPGPFCGNNITEFGEACDGTSVPVGSSCSSTCAIIPQTPPEIKWESDLTNSELWKGRNLNPGDTFIINYSAYNPSSESMDVLFDSLLYSRPYTYHDPWSNQRYYSYNLRRNDYAQERKIISVPAGETIYFNRTIIIPNWNQNQQEVLERFYYYEKFKYKKSVDSTFIYPKFTTGTTNFGWWRTTSDMTTYSTNSFSYQLRHYLYSPWNNDGGWYTRGYGIGSYTPLYAVRNLGANNPTLTTTVSEEGIPAVEITYDGGIVQASYASKIPANTFVLKSKLLEEASGDTLQSKNVLVANEFKRDDGQTIRPYQEYREGYSGYKPELELSQKISFSLDDFSKYNNKFVRINSKPYLNKTDQAIILPQGSENSDKIKIDLNDPIGLSVDTPIILYPKGAAAVTNIYQRFLLFNYLSYALFDVEVDITFLDSSENVVDSLYSYDINSTETILPAGSSYPLGVKINYIGTPEVNIDNHQVKICINYYDPEKGMKINEWRELEGLLPMCKKTDLKVFFNPITIPFIDIIPRDISYTLLNLDNESVATVIITNQGTQDASSFPVDLYVKTATFDNFTYIETKTIPSLAAGESKTLDFAFTPNTLGNFVIKIVVNEDDSVFEDDVYIKYAKKNNILTSIALVRDLDVFLVNVIIVYENAENGIIPIKAYASNKGVGGIDSYEMKLILENSENTYIQSDYFTQIPEEGKEVIYYLNVTGMEPGSYQFTVELIAPFDPDISDNVFISVIDFCPIPGFNGPLICNTYCTETFLNPSTNRYLATCHGINGCMFKDPQFAESCDGYKENSYAPIFDQFGILNTTHEAQCHQGVKIVKKAISDEDLKIDGECGEIIVNKFQGIFNSLDILVNIVECIDPEN
jgi:cysteine-rich repeat protein